MKAINQVSIYSVRFSESDKEPRFFTHSALVNYIGVDKGYFVIDGVVRYEDWTIYKCLSTTYQSFVFRSDGFEYFIDRLNLCHIKGNVY